MQVRDERKESLHHAIGPRRSPATSFVLGWEVGPVSFGKICKLTRSYGSRWGRIQPIGSDEAIFFNTASLPEGTDFASLRDGQMVEFEEEPDRANGTHAVRVVLGELPVMRKTS